MVTCFLSGRKRGQRIQRPLGGVIGEVRGMLMGGSGKTPLRRGYVWQHRGAGKAPKADKASADGHNRHLGSVSMKAKQRLRSGSTLRRASKKAGPTQIKGETPCLSVS